MKKVKRTVFSLALIALMSLTSVSAYADSATIAPETSESTSNVGDMVVPFAAKMSYSFQNLYTNESVDTGSFTISSTQDILLTLVQYPVSGSGGTANIRYNLMRSGNIVATLSVNQNFTSTNKTLTFTNAPAGTYYFRIVNQGIPDVSGNGYVN